MNISSARIRTAWKNKNRAVTPEEHAVALAAVAWRVALTAAKNIHQHQFIYEDDADRFAVIREYLYFLIHIADRCVAEHHDQQHRANFITRLSHECRRHYRENERELIDAPLPDETFVDELNLRATSYAATRFADGEPGYQTFRALGTHIQSCMGDAHENKWVQDQVQSADAIEVVRVFTRALSALNVNVAAQTSSPPAE